MKLTSRRHRPGLVSFFCERHDKTSETMETERQEDVAPAGPSTAQNQRAHDNDRKGKRMRYSIMDILMTMGLVALVAATAGPRFSKACSENRLSAMVDGLHAVRSQIERYRVEHDGLLPGQTMPGACIGAEAFIDSMTRKDGAGRGPWLRAVPANPFVTGEAAADITCVNAVDASPTGAEGTGWWFNAATGQFCACDSRFHSVY